MAKPTLVVLAAGMGSRYGGLKQVDPVGPNGELIIDDSIYDARQAGFERVVFLIKEAIHDEFDAAIGKRIATKMETHYAFQELEALLPEGFVIPEGRIKPWGTAHGILCCEPLIDGPFAVINADDFYGRDAYEKIYGFLSQSDNSKSDYAMVGYVLENTLTDFGHVARGVCETNNGYLTGIVERTHIEKTPNGPAYSVDDGKTLLPIDARCPVSMNFWGFTPTLFDVLKERFPRFLEEEVPGNPLKSEIYIPNVVGELMREGSANVRVLQSNDRWFGVTYADDKPAVVASVAELIANGRYPEQLWK